MPLNLTRALLTIILPGVVCISPWLLLIWHESDSLQNLYEKVKIPFHVVSFSLAVAVGSILEGVGNYIEHYLDQRRAAAPEPTIEQDWVHRDWIMYLRSQCANGEMVGQKYLSRKVTALYFELTMMMALPVSFLGISAFTFLSLDSSCVALIFVLLSVIGFVVLKRFSADTHEVLCETRWWLFSPVKKPEIKM